MVLEMGWFEDHALERHPAAESPAPARRRVFSDEAIARHVRDLAPHEPSTLRMLAQSEGPSRTAQTPFQQMALGTVADWISTGYGLQTGSMRELNPLLRGFKNDPTKTVAGLVAQDLATLPIVKLLERKHPTLAKWLYQGMALYRMGLTMNNLRLISGHVK